MNNQQYWEERAILKDKLLEKLQENNLTHWQKAPEGYWNGKGLNKLESCAYYAVLSSLSKEQPSKALSPILVTR